MARKETTLPLSKMTVIRNALPTAKQAVSSTHRLQQHQMTFTNPEYIFLFLIFYGKTARYWTPACCSSDF
jgi:hypothetical protein